MECNYAIKYIHIINKNELQKYCIFSSHTYSRDSWWLLEANTIGVGSMFAFVIQLFIPQNISKFRRRYLQSSRSTNSNTKLTCLINHWRTYLWYSLAIPKLVCTFYTAIIKSFSDINAKYLQLIQQHLIYTSI